MTTVTWRGLGKAVKNVALLPLRMTLWMGYLLFRLVIIAAIAFLLTVAITGGYFYFVKANEPMQIDERAIAKGWVQRPPEGMTFREFWQDRWQGWTELDKKGYESGKNRTPDRCRFVESFEIPLCLLASGGSKTFFVRYLPDSNFTIKSIIAVPFKAGYPPPDDMPFLDAWWWWGVNDVYWDTTLHDIPPCRLPPPKRPEPNG